MAPRFIDRQPGFRTGKDLSAAASRPCAGSFPQASARVTSLLCVCLSVSALSTLAAQEKAVEPAPLDSIPGTPIPLPPEATPLPPADGDLPPLSGPVAAPATEAAPPLMDTSSLSGADLDAGMSATGLDAADLTAAEAESLARDSGKEVSLLSPKFTFRLRGAVTYDDNVSLRGAGSGGKQADTLFSAGGGFTWKPFQTDHRKFSLDYEGAANFYMDHSKWNGSDHNASLQGVLDLDRTKLSIAASFASLSGVDLESRQFEDRTMASVTAMADHELTGKMRLSAAVYYTTSEYSSLRSTEGLSGKAGLNWRVTPKITTGFALMAGYTDNDSFGTRDYESLVLTGTYDPSSKLKLSADAGLQRGRTVGSDDDDDGSHFVFDLGAIYQPRDTTSINFTAGLGSVTTAVQNGGAGASNTVNYSLNAAHQFSSSTAARLFLTRTTPASAVEAGASIERTRFGAGVTQKFLDHFSVGVDAGYEISDYIPNSKGGTLTLNRNEKSWFLRSALKWMPRQDTTVILSYDFRDVSADTESLDYQQNRVGLSIVRSF